ncbi:hypothetical protein E3N88_11964 [Mikania micrantha]|uniref:DUF4219 domain-containing protein n=1 Tax=Mikania micrantha TaxID=192012 RepID=A0A5N6P758_9ASTR|nr:hypothetical protein E3N88_11964 [Mikania micrantha]
MRSRPSEVTTLEKRLPKIEDKGRTQSPGRTRSEGRDRKKKSRKINGRTKESTPASLQCPMLSMENYNIWAIRIKALFRVHGILEAIEPGPGVVVEAKKDDMAVAMLYQSIPEELVLQVAAFRTAREIWEALKTRFIGETESIDEFAMKLSQFVTRSNVLGSTIEDKVLVKKLLGAVFRVHGILEAIEPGPGVVVEAKKDGMAVAMLYLSIQEELVLQVAAFRTTKEIWEALKTSFIGVERVREAQL